MSNKKAANGAGNLRKKTITGKDGKARVYWEGRISLPNGERKSVSDTTQAGCLEKLKKLQREADFGTYVKPSKLTVAQWLDEWLSEYCKSVKPRTLIEYRAAIENHFKPKIGKVKLSDLDGRQVQKMINGLTNRKTGEPLSTKRIKDLHGILHKALQVAVKMNLINKNPADNICRPKVQMATIKPLDETQIARFIAAIEGHRFKDFYMVALFTGMRESELLGLQWDCIDFRKGTIEIRQQLQRQKGGKYVVVSTKSGKPRIIRPAQAVMDTLKKVQREQFLDRQAAGDKWENASNFVFVGDTGRNYAHTVIYQNFKRIAKQIECPDLRFHDLRHSFATLSLLNGDDIKTVSENLGHYCASFTLQIYAHTTEEAQKRSAERMNEFIKTVATA